MTTPHRGGERKLASGEGARSLPTATPRSQTQPGGHKALQRRPQADNPCSVDVDVC
ncbi:hypothetical protein H0261_21535 [Pectobacterium versatile]|uniref:hypothetical protein n=1 Tax=Pectobacterium TaxID=122277 RepID=UPI0015DDE024|nr:MULTISPECIES: hypothetical protein [Pectobacterium]MBA0186325.1 hypothetical protein [Pectobacterium versatile]